MPASALPSLLRNLTSTSRSTATLSLESPSSSTLSSDDSHSIASSSRNKAQRRRRVVSGPAGRARKESPTLTSRPRAASHERPALPKTLSETSQADTVGDFRRNVIRASPTSTQLEQRQMSAHLVREQRVAQVDLPDLVPFICKDRNDRLHDADQSTSHIFVGITGKLKSQSAHWEQPI